MLCKSSIELLKNSTIDYEFRTTIVKEFHNIENIKNMLKIIGHDSKYFLQNFEDSENVIDHTLHGFSDEELQKMKEELSEYDNLKIRGI